MCEYCAITKIPSNHHTHLILGKHIINEQFLLNRLAQSAIDIYISSCMMSRCSQSLTANLASARHEEIMTKVCIQGQKGRVLLESEIIQMSGYFPLLFCKIMPIFRLYIFRFIATRQVAELP